MDFDTFQPRRERRIKPVKVVEGSTPRPPDWFDPFAGSHRRMVRDRVRDPNRARKRDYSEDVPDDVFAQQLVDEGCADDVSEALELIADMHRTVSFGLSGLS